MSSTNMLSRLLLNKQVYVRQFSILNPLNRKIRYVADDQDLYTSKTAGEIVVTEFDKVPRDRQIDVETSIKYINSKAYYQCYGDKLVWEIYRRNKTSHYLKDTRKKCIRLDEIATASPCPICRDIYLVVDYRNIQLLNQFICPHSGAILPTIKTGVCQKQQKFIIAAIMKAQDYGLLSFEVPFRAYDYEYFKKLSNCSARNK